MAFGLLGVRLLLAAMFAVAAAGKLRDLLGFRKTLAAFGVPTSAVAVAAVLTPVVELAVAALLVSASSAWWGAAAGLALLAMFTSAAAANLAWGRRPDCACFGTASSEPLGSVTLVRNVAWSACAALLVGAGPGANLSGMAAQWGATPAEERFLSLSAVVLLAALVALDRYASRLRVSNAALASRVETLERRLGSASPTSIGGPAGLPRGTVAPPFDLPLLEGDRASLDTLRKAGQPVLLVFLDAYCAACAQLWPDIERWQQQYAGVLTVAVICGGPPQAVEMKLIGTAVTNVLLRSDSAVPEMYSQSLTPSAVMVSPDGRIDSEAVAGVPAIRDLVAQRIGA